MNEILIETEFITLGQFLKYIGAINSGSEAKYFISENVVLVNKNRCFERGKKLKNGDLIHFLDKEFIIKTKNAI